jgi:hypothetical protein
MIAVDIPSLKIIRNLNKPKSMTARANVQLTPAIGVRFRKFITTSTNRTTSVGSTTSSSVFFLRRVFGKEALDIDSAAITEGLEIRGTVMSLHGNDVCYKGGTALGVLRASSKYRGRHIYYLYVPHLQSIASLQGLIIYLRVAGCI